LSGALDQFRATARLSGFAWAASLALDRVGLPALGFWRDPVFPMPALSEQVAAILTGWGMPPEHVAITTSRLLYADFHGIDSHGCGMLLDYHRKRAAGLIAMTPDIRVLKETASTALVDGGGGMGHIAGDFAMRLAMDKAAKGGVAAVAVRNSGHYGAAGAYAAMAAEAGLIGLATTNNRMPAIVPTFGVDAKLGTNPIALAAPAARNRPFLLDMATSTVAMGKLMIAWRKGRGVPPGWALDARGRPMTAARAAYASRRLTPLGGSREMSSHKGYGLAAMVEILSSVLPGQRALDLAGDDPGVGHFFLAMDPERFAGGFAADLDAFMDDLRATRPVRCDQPVQVAGDPEYEAFAARAASGVPLSRAVVEDMRFVCAEAGLPFTLEPRTP
jgi:LDH2 family malate/lactate/ureidoglycolate dehydrogenase